MSGEARSGADAGTGASFLPPVFTHWSDEAAVSGSRPPSTAPTGPQALPEPDTASPDSAPDDDAFPVDAFIFPEDTEGMSSEPLQHSTPLSRKLLGQAHEDRTVRLADRLEALARRIRSEGAAALGEGLESRERLDALLAGVLAGYLAADDG